MKKIREQEIPGLWTSAWWDIGHGYTVLVQTKGARSTMHVLVASGDVISGPKRLFEQPPHWKANQHVDVTDKIAALAFLHDEAVLVSGEVTLSDDEIKRTHLECPVENVEQILRRLERAVSVLQVRIVRRLPEEFGGRAIAKTFNFSGPTPRHLRKKEGA